MPVQALNRSVRDEIYQRALAAVKREIARTGGSPEEPSSLIGHRLELAWQGYRVIKEWPGAPRTIIQAGPARWPRVPPELDDGVSPTRFADRWEGDPAVTRLARAGIVPAARRPDGHVAAGLPEMHVWLACPGSGEPTDFTTGPWTAACKAPLGREWLAAGPPAYLRAFGTRCPGGARYRPGRGAIATAIRFLRQQGRQCP
jgi:hypothetical protein